MTGKDVSFRSQQRSCHSLLVFVSCRDGPGKETDNTYGIATGKISSPENPDLMSIPSIHSLYVYDRLIAALREIGDHGSISGSHLVVVVVFRIKDSKDRKRFLVGRTCCNMA